MKETYDPLMNVQLGSLQQKFCLFKVNNRNTRKSCEICPNLTIKTAEKSSLLFSQKPRLRC